MMAAKSKSNTTSAPTGAPAAKRTRAPLPTLPNLDAFPEIGFSRWADLKPYVRFSREYVRLKELEGRFPRGVRASKTLVLWSNAEVRKWLADPMGYRAEAA